MQNLIHMPDSVPILLSTGIGVLLQHIQPAIPQNLQTQFSEPRDVRHFPRKLSPLDAPNYPAAVSMKKCTGGDMPCASICGTGSAFFVAPKEHSSWAMGESLVFELVPVLGGGFKGRPRTHDMCLGDSDVNHNWSL